MYNKGTVHNMCLIDLIRCAEQGSKLFFLVFWILAITIFQLLKNAITIHLIGDLPLLFCSSLILALFYVWSIVRPTCRLCICVLPRITPLREDKASQPRSYTSLPFFFRTPAAPAALVPSLFFLLYRTLVADARATADEWKSG